MSGIFFLSRLFNNRCASCLLTIFSKMRRKVSRFCLLRRKARLIYVPTSKNRLATFCRNNTLSMSNPMTFNTGFRRYVHETIFMRALLNGSFSCGQQSMYFTRYGLQGNFLYLANRSIRHRNAYLEIQATVVNSRRDHLLLLLYKKRRTSTRWVRDSRGVFRGYYYFWVHCKRVVLI